jgi:hypothetical protein
VTDARSNLAEAVALCLETAAPDEVAQRLKRELYVTQIDVAHA